MRFLALLSFVSLAGFASASFDLSLVTDSGTNSVHRIDPISNVYLGSFGSGLLSNPRGIAIDQGLNRAYILDAGSRVSTWDYNTGAFISSFNSNVGGASFLTRNSDGTLNVAGSDRVVRMNVNGAVAATYVRTGTFGVQQGILLRDGQFYMSTRTVDSRLLERFNYTTGVLIGASTWLADRLLPMPDTGAALANTFNAYVSTSTVALEIDRMSNGTIYVTDTPTTLIDTVAGVAAGHGGMMFVLGRDKLTPTRGGIVRFDKDTFVVGTTLAGTSNIVTPTGIANVVAPEPGSLAALGLGLVVLLRRKNSN
ncbi:MAG: PEP-CTERM sorting domain-containing protein [Armatimonadetes bacterium]|nr:PEP-CTERM sorting domain-containing protein [Armatimonadota bacterium]